MIEVLGAGTSVAVAGLPALVRIDNTEAQDVLAIDGGDGNDTISATTLPANVLSLVIDAGDGDDMILGSQGADIVQAGDGDDFVFGDNGDDQAQLGEGDDTFQWNPGDGNDTVEGQDGFDTLLFNGANIAEEITITANGERTIFFRNIANVTMDLGQVESIRFKALGGADSIVVGDLSGTDVEEIGIDLAGPGDGEPGRGCRQRDRHRHERRRRDQHCQRGRGRRGPGAAGPGVDRDRRGAGPARDQRPRRRRRDVRQPTSTPIR